MDSYPFAHTSPIWINQVGSTDKPARQKASRELRIALNQIEERARLAYEGDNISTLLARIDKALRAIDNR
jgi:TolB protein